MQKPLSIKVRRWMIALCMIFIATAASAQSSGHITHNFQNEPLASALKEVETVTKWNVLFAYDAVKEYNVTAKVSNATAVDAVRQLTANLPLQVTVKGKYITVSPKNNGKTGKDRHITGVVFDDMDEPLLGASVSVPGSPFGTVTDANGRFDLTIPSEIGDVTVSYIGMNTQKVTVANGKPLTVHLSADISMLNDVIVTGYQTISKERSTGAFAKVSEKELETRRLDNLANVLEGKVAGYNDGMIRGVTSMYGETAPLYVIDGFPVENQTMNYQGQVTSLTPDLNMDDIQDITVLKDAAATSIYGARAANGVIVITTKRGTQNDKMEIGFNASMAWRPYDLYTGNLASSADIVALERQWASENKNLQGDGAKDWALAQLDDNIYQTAGMRAILNHYAGNTSEAQMNSALDALAAKGYNYYDQVAQYAKRTELQQQYNLNIAKTTGKNMFKASVTYKHNAYQDIYSKDQSVGINIDNLTKITKWMDFEIGAYMNFGSEQNQSFDPLSSFSLGYNVMPYADLVNADGSYYTSYMNDRASAFKRQVFASTPALQNEDITPMDELGRGLEKSKTMSLRSFAKLNIELAPWLKYSASFQYERGSNRFSQNREKESYYVRNYINSYTGDDYAGGIIQYLPYGNIYEVRDQYRSSYNFRQQLTFDYTANDLHNITAIFGTETRENLLEMRKNTIFAYNDQTLSGQAINEQTLLSDWIVTPWGDWNSFSSETSRFYETKNRYFSMYGNAAYTYDSRYTATFSMRWDRSNLWGTSNQYQNKPVWSAGLSWNASNEKFMEDAKWVNMLKLRASYGIAGNVYPAYSPYMVTYYGTNYNIGEKYQYIATRPNNDLSWEKTTTLNLGVDFSILNNRLRGTLDYYNKYGERLLATTQGNPTEGYGYSSYAINNGEMRNRGVEVSLQGDVIRTKDLTWTLNGMFAFNHNEVMHSNGKAPVYYLALDYSSAYPTVGDQYGAIYGYEWAGLDAEGLPQVYDENGEATTSRPTNLDAIKCLANATPTYSGSFGTTVSWRGIDFSVLFTYQGNYKIRNANMPFLASEYSSVTYDNITNLSGVSKDIVNRWMKPGDEAHTSVPRACFAEAGYQLSDLNSLYFYSSANLLDASHIKLSNVSLAYNLPKDIIRKAYLQRARIQFNIENPLLFAKSDQAKYQLGGYNAATYVLGVYLNF